MIGVHKPKALTNVLKLMAKLCLRGGREHKALKLTHSTTGSEEGVHCVH